MKRSWLRLFTSMFFFFYIAMAAPYAMNKQVSKIITSSQAVIQNAYFQKEQANKNEESPTSVTVIQRPDSSNSRIVLIGLMKNTVNPTY